MSDSSALPWGAASAVETAAVDATEALIQRGLSGDDTAFVALYNLHSGMVYRLAYSLLQHPQDAEEVLQDSFEYAFRRLSLYDARKSAFTTWLYRITVSRCRNKRRRKWLPTFSLNALEEQEVADPATPTPEERLNLTERQKAVWAALGGLSPKLREVAILRYFAAMQYGEIGRVLDIPAKTAESRMRLAHKALRESLRDQLG
jgi:RNA polymerase sigma-70 factor (ECF subfamily)